MSQVKYGDTFYLFGYATNLDGSIVQGWVVPATDSTPYYAICLSCATNNNPYPLVPYTILPATSRGIQGKNSSIPDPKNSDNQFAFPITSTSPNNLRGQPVGINDFFYIGTSSVIGSTEWASSSDYMNITSSYGDLRKGYINSYSEDAQLQASNVKDPSNQNFIYGQTSFNLSLPNNDPNGNTCNGVNNKRSLFGYDFQQITTKGQTKIGPIYNYTDNHCLKNLLPPLTFVFVPIPAYICSTQSCIPLVLNSYTNQLIGTKLYNQLWGCVNYACTQGNGSEYIYPSQSLCQENCSTSNQTWNCTNSICQIINGSGGQYASLNACQNDSTNSCYQSPVNGQLWGCISGICQQGTGSEYTYNTQNSCQTDPKNSCYRSPPVQTWNCTNGICTSVQGPGGTYNTQSACQSACGMSWNCSNGTCTSVQGPGGTYNTQSACQSACTKTPITKQWWIWALVIGAVILIIIIIITIVVFAGKKKPPTKENPTRSLTSFPPYISS
jgi:hypothetical protein